MMFLFGGFIGCGLAVVRPMVGLVGDELSQHDLIPKSEIDRLVEAADMAWLK